MSELTETGNDLTEAGKVHCANCGATMQGEFCHHCGQSIHSVLKPVHHMLEDGMDMFLHVDGRILHTLPPLATRPGFLTLEYFAGRRQRYVAPFRLMFVLCLLAFFVFHLALNVIAGRIDERTFDQIAQNTDITIRAHPFADEDTAVGVQRSLRHQLDAMNLADVATRLSPDGRRKIASAKQVLRTAANARLLELGAAPLPIPSAGATQAQGSALTEPKAGQPAATSPAGTKTPVRTIQASDGWTTDPVQIAWLPDFVNQRLTSALQRLLENTKTAFNNENPKIRREAQERMITGIFSVLPQAMVVMIPLFALLLKLFYVFRRRLYMEHLIVALHSHAFLFLALPAITVTGMLSTWLKPHAAWAGLLIGYVQGAILLWIPAYLLVMQKRIYRQGWPMTVLKYACVGWCYLWLLFWVLLVAAVLGVTH